jgi:hypothetical protein
MIEFSSNHYRRRWWNLGDSQWQAKELISGPCRGTRIGLLSLTRVQSRVVIGLLTRHNTLHRHLHLMGLPDSPLCRKYGAEVENSAHILCWCEVLASIKHAYLGSFFLEPKDIKSQNLWAIWRFSKAARLTWKMIRALRAGFIEAQAHRGWKAPNPYNNLI